VPLATPTPAAPAAAAAEAGEYTLRAEDIYFHPDPQLHSGDLVSVEVVGDNLPPEWQGAAVTLYHEAVNTLPLGKTNFARFGLGGRQQATFTWVWDTAGLEGSQTIIVVVSPLVIAPGLAPEPQSLAVTVDLLPAETVALPETLAEWARAESECCLFHYLTGTAAERDLAHIMAEADAAFEHVEDVLGVRANQKVPFTLVSRLLGHGGFASGEISLTYIDRNPAESDLFPLFAHEGTHLLDRRLARTRPLMLTEGLAVYVAGGHFKPEDLERRAAAVLALERYIPLAWLADNFYPAQHEIGYLQGGAFIQYLVARFGWGRFKAFYASFQPAPSDATMLDNALQLSFGLSLAQVEADWLAHLRTLPRDEAEMADVALTVELFDTLRRYQQLMDPSAYFLAAWLPDGRAARERSITADFVRHPRMPDNIALEAMLQAAGQALRLKDYPDAAELLDGANAALDAGDLAAHPLSLAYAQVVADLLAAGYEPQTIVLDGARAEVQAIRDWPRLEALSLVRQDVGWQVAR
jgi:hypothetical protein